MTASWSFPTRSITSRRTTPGCAQPDHRAGRRPDDELGPMTTPPEEGHSPGESPPVPAAGATRASAEGATAAPPQALPHHHVPDEELLKGESVLEVIEEPPGEVPRAEIVDQLSLARRLRRPRTIVSLALPILLIALIIVSLPGFKLSELPGKILAARP